MTLKKYIMDISLEIDKLTKEKSDLAAVIVVYKERIKEIDKKCRKLSTVLKHAESIVVDEEAVKEHEESEA